MKLLVTGVTGFVGSSLLQSLLVDGHHVPTAAVRSGSCQFDEVQSVAVGDLLADADWSQALLGIDVVIHLAARAHIMKDMASNPLAAFRTTNTDGTLSLANQAALAGVRRFIYISSIKVNGEQSAAEMPFTADEIQRPADPYGVSKYEAEQGLRELASETGMEVVIIRPPLVYGPGVKANFLSMIRWLDKGIPLPLGLIRNKRSLVSLDNLVDLITICIDHPAAANQSFLVSDDDDLSTADLLQRLGSELGKPARLLPIPPSMLASSLALLGKGAIGQRLCGSLQVDISKTKDLLGWAPPLSVDEALHKTVQAYLASKHRDI